MGGAVHFSLRVPQEYDGTRPYALFISLPGWEGLWFQETGANMDDDFATEASRYVPDMITVSPQLEDWGTRSAEQTIALTEYLIESYNIDRDRVYLEGYSGGGETGSIVMGMRPSLYTAFLCCSTKWDGDMRTLVSSGVPVYMAVGEDDSYYGSGPLRDAYRSIRNLYVSSGTDDATITEKLVLEVKDDAYFRAAGYTDQHAGGMAFAHDREIMGWLFGKH